MGHPAGKDPCCTQSLSSVSVYRSPVRCQWTVSVSSVLYPSFNGSPPSPEALKKLKKEVKLNFAMGDFAAQASSESVRGPRNIGKRKSKWTGAPKALENICPNGPWAAQHVPWVSWQILAPAWTIPGLSQMPPMLQNIGKRRLK